MSKSRYILVADAGRARIFKSDTGMTALELVQQLDNPGGRSTPAELQSDRPGQQRSGSGGFHGLGGDRNPQRHQSDEFAALLAGLLHSAHQSGKFAELLIAAPPRFLGELRQHLSADCQKTLGATVHKDLVRASDAEIISHLR